MGVMIFLDQPWSGKLWRLCVNAIMLMQTLRSPLIGRKRQLLIELFIYSFWFLELYSFFQECPALDNPVSRPFHANRVKYLISVMAQSSLSHTIIFLCVHFFFVLFEIGGRSALLYLLMTLLQRLLGWRNLRCRTLSFSWVSIFSSSTLRSAAGSVNPFISFHLITTARSKRVWLTCR